MSQGPALQSDTTTASKATVSASQSSELPTSTSPSVTNPSTLQSFSSATDVSRLPPAADDVPMKPRVKQEAVGSSSPPAVLEGVRKTADSDTSSTSSRASTSPGGPKRMAGGAVKSTSPSGAANATSTAYRRKSTLDVSGRRISELSLQLKTRLTYAMIKVQNGWEQRSIDEVESLAASAMSSPLTPSSTTMAHGYSPRTTMASISGRLRANDASAGVAGAYRSAASSRPGTGNSGWPQPSPNLQAQPARTLAPAPDLRPKARHHHQPSKPQVEAPLRVTTPTPQEKDAVDTLLFMSSPANSQRFTHRPTDSLSVHNSPPPSRGHGHAHGHFTMPRRSFGASSTIGPPTLYDRASASSEEEAAAAYLSTSTSKRGVGASTADAERRAKRRSYGRLESEMDVDRLLDQMRDVASSEEETDIAIPVAAHKPVVVRM